MKKKISLMFGFILLFMVFLAPNVVNARELPTGSNFDYSIDMFTTTYYISYDLDGGTLDKITTYTPENDDFEIGIPTKSGYTFLGWTGSNGNIPNPKVTVKKGTIMNLTFKANWKKNKFGINYDFNGGYGEVAPTYYDIETQQIVLGEPERLGYTFTGWTGSNGNSPQKDVRVASDTRDKSFKANWQINTYEIKYNANDNAVMRATLASNPATYNVLTNTFTLTNPTRTAYTFEGWTGTNGKTNQKTVSISRGSVGDRWYQANWKVITYNITYNLNGGTGVSNRTYTIETPSFTLPHPSKTGYTFKGYTGTDLSAKTMDVTIYQKYGDRNYDANWEANKYTVTLNKQSGSGGSNHVTATYDSGMPSMTRPSRTGYTFDGYFDGTNGSGTKYYNADGSSARTWNKPNDATLYAKWNINTYTVTYMKDGSVYATRSVPYQGNIENLTPGGYDDYHRFGGWSGWPADGKMPAGDLTLTATTSETYCRLQTGTASKANAEGLQAIFTDVGYQSSLYNDENGWGAITDYALTRSQVDGLKGIFADRVPWSGATPYLNWLSINCDNGHGENWKRYSNGNTWTILDQW